MKPFDYLLYGLTIFAWSTSWLPLRWQLGVVAPEVSLFWRFIFAGLIMMVVAKLSGHSLRLTKEVHLRIAVLSLFLFSFNFLSFYYGGLGVSSGLLAVVFSTASLMVILEKAVIDRQWPEVRLLFAAILGIGGIILIFLPELEKGHAPLASLMFCFMGTLIFSLGNILSGRLQSRQVSVISSNSWGMLYGATYLGLVAVFCGDAFILEYSWKYLGGLSWLVIISTVMAFTCYLTLIGRIGPGRASYITVIFPVAALLISQLMEDYEWTYLSLVGLGLVAFGNTIMARSAKSRTN